MVFKRAAALVLSLLIVLSCVLISADAATFTVNEKLSASTVYLLNLDTDTVVVDINSDKKVFPASTTKIMTYIVTVEQIEDIKGTKVMIKQEVLDKLIGTGSSVSGLQTFVDKEVTVYDLLAALMIKSGNDAAMVLADHIGGGSIQKFVDLMNAKANELGCVNTHFMNPHGLHDEDHYTTAQDLALISRYAMTLPEFNEIVNTTTAYLSIDKDKEYPLITTNYLIDETRGGDLYYPYAKGIKTGTTDEAGYCLVSTASHNGYTYMAVVLGAPCVDKNGKEIETNGAMQDTITLYNWAFDNLELKTVINEQTPVCEIPIELAWNQDKLLLIPQGSFSSILPKDVESSSIDIVTSIPESITAPVTEGDVIGTATISYANQELTTVNLIASETIELSKMMYFMDYAKKILKSKGMMIAVCVVAVLLVFYIILTLAYNKKKMKNRKMKEKKRRKRKGSGSVR